jgi:hypothetical protein
LLPDHRDRGRANNANPQTPLSFNGPTKATDVAKKIAGYLGLNLIDNGVKTILQSPYYPHDAMTMMNKLSEHAGFSYHIDRGNLVINPPGGSSSDSAPLISKTTGMVGYPVLNSQQITLKTEFGRPMVKRTQNIQIQGEITPANGTWNIFKLDHEIESQTPHGKWFSILHCSPPSSDAPQ